jgi:hypothetical protein
MVICSKCKRKISLLGSKHEYTNKKGEDIIYCYKCNKKYEEEQEEKKKRKKNE